MVPSFESVDLKIDINRFDIKVHIHGNIWSDFANLFTVFFQHQIVDAITEIMTVTIQTGIPYIGNNFMAKTDGYLPIPLVNNWELDWETPKAALVTSDYISIGAKALFFDKAVPEIDQEPLVAIPNMPYKDSSVKQ